MTQVTRARERKRVREQFWLNKYNARDKAIGKALEGKKEQRLFTETIRSGVELMLTLQAGDVSILLRLFPNVQADLNRRYMTGE